jgi:hypothetical protein
LSWKWIRQELWSMQFSMEGVLILFSLGMAISEI